MPSARHALGLTVLALVSGCSRDRGRLPAHSDPARVWANAGDRAGASPIAPAASGPAPSIVVSPPVASPVASSAAPRFLTLAEARVYMTKLVNRDRATQGLEPVTLDEGPPTLAGQRHADDMAKNGFLGHWGSDGSVPEQRHTEAGGADMVLENASCFTDEATRVLDTDPQIDPRALEKTEAMFFDEQPPNDGHRRNILRPQHRRVGIGIAQPRATETEVPVPCVTQEFTDPYGTYQSIPARARVGQVLHVEGALAKPATVTGVGVARVDAPRPIPIADANRRRRYPVPAPYAMYWPPGFVTAIPLEVRKDSFRIDVPLSDRSRAGLYSLSIWAKFPGSNDNVLVGLRTILVTR